MKRTIESSMTTRSDKRYKITEPTYQPLHVPDILMAIVTNGGMDARTISVLLLVDKRINFILKCPSSKKFILDSLTDIQKKSFSLLKTPHGILRYVLTNPRGCLLSTTHVIEFDIELFWINVSFFFADDHILC